MIELNIAQSSSRRRLNILCLGAHCDDIDLGCGGSLLALLRKHPAAHVTWVTFSGSTERERELRASARRFLRSAALANVVTHRFRDGFFPGQFTAIKDSFEGLKRLPRPDLIFTHERDDVHQDHRIVAELTWNTFRSHLIFEYEIPKYEGGLTTPSAYVALERTDVERKIRILLASYRTQREKTWFTADTFRALMRLRGIESGAKSGWAEGFHIAKMLVT